MTSKIVYSGGLRTRATPRCVAASEIETGAPSDNHGKGESFSPTDLAAASLGASMTAIMAVAARDRHMNPENTEVEIEKIMAEAPRTDTGDQTEHRRPES